MPAALQQSLSPQWGCGRDRRIVSVVTIANDSIAQPHVNLLSACLQIGLAAAAAALALVIAAV